MPETEAWQYREYDYIVVGSGAGGGPVAANLARAGYTVALMEAGGADTTATYEVPAFFAQASEDAALRWDYIVRHYDDTARQSRDPKAESLRGEFGNWYPRSGTLGGCTAHHALITVCPHDSDWEHIADLTGDESWRAVRMQRYFEQIERCCYQTEPNFSRPHPGGHGFTGWLSTHIARPKLLVSDWKVVRIVWAALMTAIEGKARRSLLYFWQSWRKFEGSPLDFVMSFFDPNDMRLASFEREGMFYVPFSTERGRRVSVRDLLTVTMQNHGDRLAIYTSALVTRLLFDHPADGTAPRATGVEFLEGMHLYAADPRADAAMPSPPPQRLRARREVILAGGAFNSPQLLMLSGIGPREELERHGIEVLVERRGVGRNLQDRYEAGVVCETLDAFRITRGSTFRWPARGEYPDPQFHAWLRGHGPYTTNGVLVCLTRKSSPDRAEPDLFLFCVPGIFKGYYQGWTRDIATNKQQFSWLILKSHTQNQAGSVTLKSGNPRETPHVAFRYFDEGSPGHEADLDAVVDGINYVRRINAKVADLIARELVPGDEVAGDEALRDFVRDNAWGHHASCSNAMGRADDPDAVVDSRFRVIGTRGLRIVDASVFPRIPGFFIVTPIYMIAEKASEEIIADARAAAPAPPPAVETPAAP
jgi:choline dehydrogenase